MKGSAARSPSGGSTGPRVRRRNPMDYEEDLAMRADLVVGTRFPDLELPDHRNEQVKLTTLANGFPLIVSFYRGYW
jgi:hypothetical protein